MRRKTKGSICAGMRHRLPFGTGTQKKQMCFFYIPATPCGGGREKEIGAGGTAMKKSWKKRFLLVLAPLVAVVCIPIIINESYKANSGYMTMWSAADALSYHICSPPKITQQKIIIDRVHRLGWWTVCCCTGQLELRIERCYINKIYKCALRDRIYEQ